MLVSIGWIAHAARMAWVHTRPAWWCKTSVRLRMPNLWARKVWDIAVCNGKQSLTIQKALGTIRSFTWLYPLVERKFAFEYSRINVPCWRQKLDVSTYFTKARLPIMGFGGAQAQHLVEIRNREMVCNGTSQCSLNLWPKDVCFTVYGVDVLASKEFRLHKSWASVAPYAGVSSYLTNSHEKVPWLLAR